MEKQFAHIGKIHSAQGIRGDIFVYIFAEEAYWQDRWKELHLSSASGQQPDKVFQIEKVKKHQKQKKPGFVLKLKEVSDRNLSEEMVGMKVYIPEDFLKSSEEEGIYLREVLNFEVVDKKRGPVGKIIGFMDNGMQDLLVIHDAKGVEFEVPFVEPILTEILMEKFQVLMDIPYGLVPEEEL